MAENEGFLDRWSKRKRAARETDRPPEVALAPEVAPAHDPIPAPAAEPIAATDEPEIDPADLPPLESIRGGADVQAFLQKGVPTALRRAALRRLWSADPVIREFREVADYDWDFNAPGYGALLPADDAKAAAEKLFSAMRRQVAVDAPAPPEHATTRLTPPEAEPEPEPAPRLPERQLPNTAETDATPPATTVPEPASAPATAAPSPAPPPRRRRHGSAVPS